jgi:hypothetical protein
MSDDFIKIKPKIGPIEFDLNVLWRRLMQNEKTSEVAIVAYRFLRLFVDHGIAVTQIQQYLPEITLDKLATLNMLLAALNNEALDRAAKLFKVRRTWLDGVDDQIYEWQTCYKTPARMFEDLASLEKQIGSFPVRALYCGRKPDRSDDKEQPLVLLLVEKIRDMGDEQICRYIIYGDSWDWRHPICRIQLKSMARLVDKVYGMPVPLYHVKPNVLERIREGKCVPREFLNRSPLTEPSLEDYALSQNESAQSKEHDELPHVFEYIKFHDLENVAHRALRGSCE